MRRRRNRRRSVVTDGYPVGSVVTLQTCPRRASYGGAFRHQLSARLAINSAQYSMFNNAPAAHPAYTMRAGGATSVCHAVLLGIFAWFVTLRCRACLRWRAPVDTAPLPRERCILCVTGVYFISRAHAVSPKQRVFWRAGPFRVLLAFRATATAGQEEHGCALHRGVCASMYRRRRRWRRLKYNRWWRLPFMVLSQAYWHFAGIIGVPSRLHRPQPPGYLLCLNGAASPHLPQPSTLPLCYFCLLLPHPPPPPLLTSISSSGEGTILALYMPIYVPTLLSCLPLY